MDMSCNEAFDNWYASQKHMLGNDEVCRAIFKAGWESAQNEWRSPLSEAEIKMIATYSPEGVNDGEVAEIVRRVEQMHGLFEAAVKKCEHVIVQTGMYEPFDIACEKCGSFVDA